MINEKNLLDIMQIKKDELKSNAPFNDEFCRGFAFAMEFVKQEPTIEAEPVVHGEWVPHNRMTRSPLVVNYACSECGKDGHKTNFCPNCGADMRGDQNE